MIPYLLCMELFFNVLATFAEFEGDLIRLRTREGMAIARAKGKLRGKQPKLSDKQQKNFAVCMKPGSTQSAIWLNCFQCHVQQSTGHFCEGKMIDLTAEQRQLAKIVHDYASRFP